MNALLQQLLPGLASAFGGPLAGAAVEFVSSKLGLTNQTVTSIQQTLSGMTGDQLVQMKKIDDDFQTHMADNGIQLQVAQIATNTEEAKSTNWWVAGWRPYVGWIGGTSLAYVAIVEPIARFIAQVGFHYAGPFPSIDTTVTMQVLTGILGIGVMRTAEKVKGAEGNR